jgi:hypothetical protein
LTPDVIVQAYERGFGRTPSPEDIDVHMKNPGGYQGFLNTVAYSDEGQGRGLSPRDLTVWNPDVRRTTPPPTNTTPLGGRSAGDASHLFTGYDFGQDAANREGSKSAKYNFSHYAGPAALTDDRWKRKETAGAFFEQYVRPGMEADGYKIHEVVGDKVRVSTRESDAAGLTNGAWIDWVVGADGENPMLAWQDETMGGGGARGMTAQTQPTNHTMPQPIQNPDGTVSIRVTPEAYRRYAGDGYTRFSRGRRSPLTLIPGMGEPPPPAEVA